MSRERPQVCSFCGKKPEAVGRLIAGPGVNICDQCVRVCSGMLVGDEPKPRPVENLRVPVPREICSFLDQYVVGQTEVKKVLSVAVHNHYKRLKQGQHFKEADPFPDVEIEKSNILLIGPTGCGKTLLARTLAKMLDVPFAIADATTVTEAGYVGEDVENILLTLIQNADFDVARAETGIIYIDEVDKKSRKTDNVSITRDVSGEGVQQALLKILEGTVARVPPAGGRKHPQQEYIKINTDHILFICGGAFVGLEDIVRRRLGKQLIGFRDPQAPEKVVSKDESVLSRVEPEDLISFGLIPEMVGRLPIVSCLQSLTEEELVRILTEPKNAMVKQYRKLLAMDGLDLQFTEGALRELARLAERRKAGARGLRAMIEKLMLDVMFEGAALADRGVIRVSERMVRQFNVLGDASLKSLKIA